MSKPIAATYPVAVAISAIKEAPRINGNRINWAADKSIMAKVAIAILAAPDANAAIAQITGATGVQSWTMKHFIRGNNASGGAEQEVRDAIKAAGLEHVTIDGRKRQRATAPATTAVDFASEIEHIDALNKAAAERRKPAADAVPPATAVIKPATLAVTNKGEVVSAALPTAATTPSPMVATGGDYAVKTTTQRCAIDIATGDILVITTRRILYGSVEHRAKMIEMNTAKKS